MSDLSARLRDDTKADEECSQKFQLRLREDTGVFEGKLTRGLEILDATDFAAAFGILERPAVLAARFASPMRWAVACKQFVDRKPCKGLSVKRYIFFRGKNLLQHEALLAAALVEVSHPSSCTHVSHTHTHTHTHTPVCAAMAACDRPSTQASATAQSESGVVACEGAGPEEMAAEQSAADVRLPFAASLERE